MSFSPAEVYAGPVIDAGIFDGCPTHYSGRLPFFYAMEEPRLDRAIPTGREILYVGPMRTFRFNWDEALKGWVWDAKA